MKKIISILLLTLTLLFCLPCTVHADDADKILQVYFSQNEAEKKCVMRIFTSVPLDENTKVEIDGKVFEAEVKNINDLQIKTTFLIDNSSSMKRCDELKNEIVAYMSKMPECEGIKFVAFDTQMNGLDDVYREKDTSDLIRAHLDKKYNFNGQASPFNKALYNTLAPENSDNAVNYDIYYRTVFISDCIEYGKDDMPFSILEAKIANDGCYHVDIVQVDVGKNTTAGFDAIGKLGSNTFMSFRDGSNFDSLLPNVYMAKIELTGEVANGGSKGFTLQTSEGNVVLNNIKFPKVSYVAETTTVTTTTAATTKATTTATTPAPVVEDSLKTGTIVLIVLAVVLGLAAIGVAVFLIMRKMKKPKKCIIRVMIIKDSLSDKNGVGQFTWEFNLKEHYSVGRNLNPINDKGELLPPNQTAIIECETDGDIGNIGRNAFEIYYNKNEKKVYIKNIAQRAVFYVKKSNAPDPEKLNCSREMFIEKNYSILLGRYTTINITDIILS